MDFSHSKDAGSTILYVGHDEARRPYTVTADIFEIAQQRGYDTLTIPITNHNYKPRVVSRLLLYLESAEAVATDDTNQHCSSARVPAIQPLDPGEIDLTPDAFTSRCLLTTASWTDLASPDPLIGAVSKQVLLQEVQYAAFCCGVNIIIPGPRPRGGFLHRDGLARYARAIAEAFDMGPNLHFQISLPMSFDVDDQAANDAADLALFADEKRVPSNAQAWDPTIEPMGAWEVWNLIRTTCNYNPRLSLALTFPRHLPGLAVQSRWIAEPLRILHLPRVSFVANKLGVEVLTKSQQSLLTRCLRLRNAPWILLSGVSPILDNQKVPEDQNSAVEPTPVEASNTTKKPSKSTSHIEYIRQHVQMKQPPKSFTEQEGMGYEDYLQNPLQPLAQDLESMTYETFERCPVKYEWYEKAIANALTDWKMEGKRSSGSDGKIVVAILGAGRGPLITRALQASAKTGISIDLWAVEKNSSAFIVLQRHNQTWWHDRVHLIRSDMRTWAGPSYPSVDLDRGSIPSEAATHPNPGGTVDIIISELLGSFGDNELSPECLDGAQHLLSQPYGLSIPHSYSAHLTPISAPKLHADIASRAAGDSQVWQIPYVVMLQAFDYLSLVPRPHHHPVLKSCDDGQANGTGPWPTSVPSVQEAWSFTHPRGDLREEGNGNENGHNSRFTRLSFPCSTRGVCHGLAGYFEAVLYAKTSSQSNGHVESATNIVEADSSTPNGLSYQPSKESVEISTNPVNMEKKSKDMISWFPMFFPLKTPLYIPDKSELHVSMWRQTDGRKIWYEWMVEIFLRLERGNPIKVGMSELHSSIKDGCIL
ncbi:MAG: methyltransferase protein [Chrysothrix sp. TS-e1954]|nr:MAG: methyltransferase protein [Chrysothrix sp. TS-e1954]